MAVQDFRDQLIAASLKPALHLAALIGTFPRSIDRGLIEARAISDCGSPHAVFPRSIDRGLIEALLNSWHRGRKLAFPRSADRGLIEAANWVAQRTICSQISAIN